MPPFWDRPSVSRVIAPLGDVEPVDLGELVATHVLEKEKVASGPRLIDGLGDRLVRRR